MEAKRDRHHHAESLWRALYEVALHLYPRRFQEAFAPDMSRTFAGKLSDVRPAGRVRVAAFLVSEFAGLLGSVVRVRAGWTTTRAGLPPVQRHRRPFSTLRRELRHGARRLARSPGFTIASVLTLALGVGATTAVYSLVHSTVLSPLPYPESDQLVWLDHMAPGLGGDGSLGNTLGMADGLYDHYKDRVPSLTDMAIWRPAEVTLSTDNPERVAGVDVTPSFFRALGVQPVAGRVFSDAEVSAGAPGIVLSYALWQRRFGGEPTVVGRTVTADGSVVEVLGVMPKGFGFPDEAVEFWRPLDVNVTATGFGGFSREGIARLAPGATRASAEAEVRAAIPSLVDAFDGIQTMLDDTQLQPAIPTLKEHVVRDAERTLWILLGSVAFVLLLACANVANLLLVRVESRHQEAAVREALGAGRADIVRYYLAEGFLLSLGGGIVGVALAMLAVRVLVRVGPQHLPRLSELAVSMPALGMTAAVLFATTMVFGLGPVLRPTSSLAATVKRAGRGMHGGRASTRVRNGLVVAQVSLSLVLLVATGLMGRSFAHLVSLDPGFEAAGALTFRVGLPIARYESQADAVSFHREALERMSALPGVEVVGATSCLPLCGSWHGTQLLVEGRPDDPNTVLGVVAIRRVSEDFFAAVQMRLLAGRLPTRADQLSGSGAVAISAALAADYWPDEDPIGARFDSGAGEDNWLTVVGVVDDTPIRTLTDGPPAIAYLPLLDGALSRVSSHELSYVLRTSVRPESLAGAAREVIQSLDPAVPLARVATLQTLVSQSNVSTAFTTVVLGIAAGIALLLGLVGIYGVISYMVGRRSKEIGIRIALGARSGQVSRSVLAQGGRVTAIGLSIGVVAALGLTRVMQRLLFGVSPTDPLTFVAVTLLLLGFALAATYIPARRAARVDPAQALRAD